MPYESERVPVTPGMFNSGHPVFDATIQISTAALTRSPFTAASIVDIYRHVKAVWESEQKAGRVPLDTPPEHPAEPEQPAE